VINDLTRQLNEKAPEPKKEKKKDLYKAVKGDLVDELLARYLNQI
jgi:hypothetical protein